MRIRLALKVIFYFCGTCLHELAHYVAALLLGKAESFSVIPKIEGNRFVLGSVRSSVRYKFLLSFIALAPLVWWAVLLLILLFLHIIELSDGIPGIPAELIAKRLESISFPDILYLWAFTQLLWAGCPSVQDLRNVLRGLFSVSGVAFLSVAAVLLFYLCRY